MFLSMSPFAAVESAPVLAATFYHVVYVVYLVPRNDMIEVYTQTVVAGMSRYHVRRKFSMSHLVQNPSQTRALTIKPNSHRITISIKRVRNTFMASRLSDDTADQIPAPPSHF